MSILVVDDEEWLRTMLAEELRDVGYTVAQASSADAAIETILSSGPFELVLTDVRMPGSIDGMGLARWIRAHAPTTKVFVVSAYAGELPAGPIPFDAFMSKPIPFAKLLASMKRLQAAAPNE